MKEDETKEGSRKQNFLSDKTFCDLSDNRRDAGCMRHEQNSEQAAVGKVYNIATFVVFPNNVELGKLIMHSLYGCIVDMSVFSRKDTRKAFSKKFLFCFMTVKVLFVDILIKIHWRCIWRLMP